MEVEKYYKITVEYRMKGLEGFLNVLRKITDWDEALSVYDEMWNFNGFVENTQKTILQEWGLLAEPKMYKFEKPKIIEIRERSLDPFDVIAYDPDDMDMYKSPIIDALKNEENNLRVSNGERWLVWDNEKRWQVMSRKYGQKKTRLIVAGFNEKESVEELLNEQC